MAAADLLADVARRYPGRVEARFVPPGTRGWVGVDALVAVPEAFERLVDATAARYRTGDHALAVAQVVREAVSVTTGAAVAGWARHGRLLDWRAGNVALRPSERGLVVALRRPHLVVTPGDPLAGAAGVRVAGGDDALLATLDADLLGPSVPAGDMPPEPPWRAASVAAVVAAGRRAARTGSRHYWGSAALAATVALAAAARDVGPSADAARDALLARRPDLARTVELRDDAGGAGTAGCARRLTCCLLIKLPDAPQCATCPLTPGAGRRLRPRGPGTGGPAAAPARGTG